MAYVVGLTATDGCLISGRRKINFKSQDRDLVVTYLGLLGRTNRVRVQRTVRGGVAYFTEFGDTHFYGWLLSIGLMPRKSLVLGPLAVPDQYLFPLLRGLFEGDGSIQNFVHHPTRARYPDYAYERLWVFFTSASRAHVEWISGCVSRLLGAVGYLETRPPRPGRHALFRLKYGNRDSIQLLRAMYPDDDVPKLERKWKIWSDYQKRMTRG
jgi:hypothetical protein